MANDIQPGDVVVCVDNRPNDPSEMTHEACSRLKVGRHYRVIRIGVGYIHKEQCIAVDGLRNSDINPPWDDLWRVARFRKIHPGKMEFSGLTERVREDA